MKPDRIYMPQNLPPMFIRGLAKELVLDAIDKEFADQFARPMEGEDDPDIRHEMVKQRNRIARFLGLPEVERIQPKYREE